MPGLFGYMIAIVLTLGGYLAGLHWLVNPPDPWQPNPKIAQIAQQTARKRLPVVTPAPTAATPVAPEIQLAAVGSPEMVQASESVTAQRTGLHRVEQPRPAVQPMRIMREISPTKTGLGHRKRMEQIPSRKLQLMVLRTYERSDGKRFTRLLPLSAARQALAFRSDGAW